MRAGFCVLGPLLARAAPRSSRCPADARSAIGPSICTWPASRRSGRRSRIEHGYVVARAGRLTGATIHLAGPRGPTVTGTANVLSAAVLARGETTLTGAAVEPEIVDLGRLLVAMGAKIEGLGTSTLRVDRRRASLRRDPSRDSRPDRGRHAAPGRRHHPGLDHRDRRHARASRRCAGQAGHGRFRVGDRPGLGENRGRRRRASRRHHRRALPGRADRHPGPVDGAYEPGGRPQHGARPRVSRPVHARRRAESARAPESNTPTAPPWSPACRG